MTPDETRPWQARLICCGYEQETLTFPTWEAADAFREEWSASGSPYHNERCAIVERSR